jgi:hypothetical protein
VSEGSCFESSTCDAEQGVGEVDAREVGAVRDHVGQLDELGPAPAREQLRVSVLTPHTQYAMHRDGDDG